MGPYAPPVSDDGNAGAADDGEPEGGSGRDYDLPVDAEAAYAGRLNKGAGRGGLRERRVGYVRLRRQAWDGLWALQRAGELSPMDLAIVVGLVTRAGYRPGRVGVVTGNLRELADALGVRQQSLRQTCRRADRLGLLDELVTDAGDRVGWRFTRDAWFWLTAPGRGERPAPGPVAERLVPPPGPASPATASAGPEPRPAQSPDDEEEWGEYGDPFADPSRRIPPA